MSLDIAARKYLGVPFIHQGRNPGIGIDCIGLLVLAAKDCGIDISPYDAKNYARNPAMGKLQSALRSAMVEVGELNPGCVVSVDFKGQTRHVAIVGRLEDGRLSLIHTMSNINNQSRKEIGRVIEHGIDQKWLRRITGVYKLESR